MVHTATQPKIVSITYGEENHKGGILCNHILLRLPPRYAVTTEYNQKT